MNHLKMIIEFSMHWSALYVGVVCLTILQCVFGNVPTDLTFKVNRWIQCPQLDSKFRFLLDKSLKECVYECVLRSHCKGVAYRRSFTLCELHTDRDGPLRNDRDDGGCVFVARNDISTQSIQSSCQADGPPTYDPDSDNCSYKECISFKLDNGIILGNMNFVGARRKVECSPGYEEATGKIYSQCLDTGNWDYIPLCVKPIRLGEQCFVSWGAYNVSLCEDPIAECTVATVATGNTVCQCPDDYYDNNGDDVGGSCAPKLALGGQCTVSESNACLDPNAICQEYVCKCDTNYYEDNSICKECPGDEWVHPSDNETFRIKIYKDRKNQAEAILACEADNATLVKLDNEWKFNFLRRILPQCRDRNRWYWVDGKQLDNGTWVFRDNDPVPMDVNIFWLKDNFGNNRDCIYIYSAGGNYYMYDINCNKDIYFICEQS